MGMIRGGLLTLVAILLFLSLFAMNTFGTISMSLDYDSLKPEMTNVVSEIIRDQIDITESIDLSMIGSQLICQNNNTEIVQEFGGKVYTIPCEIISQGSEAVVTYIIGDFVEQVYYDEYDCDFWDCSYTPPYHLVSSKAKSYWSGWFYTALVISLLLAVGGFFLIENKKSYPFMLGGLIFISVLPFAKVSWLLALLGSWEFLSFFTIFFAKAYSVFIIMFILALVLVGVGIVLKFMSIVNFFSRLFGKSKNGKVAVVNDLSTQPPHIDKEKLKQEIKEEMKAENKKKKSKSI